MAPSQLPTRRQIHCLRRWPCPTSCLAWQPSSTRRWWWRQLGCRRKHRHWLRCSQGTTGQWPGWPWRPGWLRAYCSPFVCVACFASYCIMIRIQIYDTINSTLCQAANNSPLEISGIKGKTPLLGRL